MEEEKQMFENRINLQPLGEAVEMVKNEIGKYIIGQEKMIDQLLIAILANGHVLIEGVPGIAKTMAAKLIAACISTGFSRIQFTPDLMPSDITGTTIFNISKSEFEFNKGPLFSNMILIDEINRAPAKTQSALFEVMEERQITVDGKTYRMNAPFIVFATQNPIEHEGTYKLPEAQLDRFFFKINVGYPTVDDEAKILEIHHLQQGINACELIKPVLTAAQIVEFQRYVLKVQVESKIRDYIAAIVSKTRNNDALYLGASPRASIAIMTAAKALAAISQRDFITPDDVKEVALPVLVHRVIITPEKEMEGITANEIIRQIVESVEIPR